MNQDYTLLYKALSYHFKQAHYLKTALTHRSVGTLNNERLEFLGDALLSSIVADKLFVNFPEANEGELTRFRAHLVKRDTLVEIAQYLELGQYLHLGGGELKTGGEQRASILADAVEAIIAAIYLDSDMNTCQSIVLKLWKDRLSHLSLCTIKDPKTRLQEYLQSKKQPLPTYRVIIIGGSPHAQEFEVECIVSVLAQATSGKGETRRRAEQSAAEKALRVLHVE